MGAGGRGQGRAASGFAGLGRFAAPGALQGPGTGAGLPGDAVGGAEADGTGVGGRREGVAVTAGGAGRALRTWEESATVVSDGPC